MPVFSYAVGEKLAGEKTALGLRPWMGLVSGVWSSVPTVLYNKKNKLGLEQMVCNYQSKKK
jgi:hypothetical protein